MSGNNWQSGVWVEGRPNQTYSPVWDRVSPGFFEALGVHVPRGRVFDARDTPDAPRVAVINQEFADKIFAGEEPIGKRFGMGGARNSADYQVVGVVNNVTFRDPRQPVPPPMFFVPLLQMDKSDWADSGKARSNFVHSILLRVTRNAPDLTENVNRTLSTIDPNLTMLNAVTMEGQLSDLLPHERLLARLGELFGLLALLLASVGLYGVTAYSVSQRTREMGIRTAIGATRIRLMRMVLTSALRQVAIGLAIGIPATLMVARLLAAQVYGVTTSDPFIMAGAAAILTASALVAGFIPALRAANADPVRSLRAEGF